MQREEFEQFKTEMMEALMATQADVDALTATVTTMQEEGAAAVAAITEEISKLESGLDLGPLTSAVQSLQATVDSVKNLAPTPAAAPAEEPATVADAPASATDASQLSKAVYTTTLPAAGVDQTAWTATGYETANDPSGSPQALYYFNADSDGGTASGAGADNGAWSVYTGPVQPVPAN